MINRLAAQHMEERQMATLRWESDLAHARDTQAREFKEWVMCVYDEINGTSTSCPDDRSKKRSHHPNSNAFGVSRSESSFSIEAMSTAPVMQESFTITLGAQMKQVSQGGRHIASDAVTNAINELNY